MKNLNEVVRMGLGSIGATSRPPRLGRIWRNSTCSRATLKAGAAKSLFTESRLLLKHIPFQSIRAHRPLPLHHTVHPFNLTMTKSHLQILNFIILICQVWHLISGFLTCVCLALWRAPFVLRALRNLAVEEKREWINIYVHYQLLQRQYTEREAIRA